VTGALLAERVSVHGLEPDDEHRLANLFDTVLSSFGSTHRHDPTCAWWVPGRLEVFGKHTDYAGGRTIVAPVPRGFVFVAAPRADGIVDVLDARTGEHIVTDAAVSAFSGWRHYVEVVIRRLRANFPGEHAGASIVFASDLPRASGMSSSSALVVGIASSLTRLWALHGHDNWTGSIQSLEDRAIYYACLENGLSFRSLAGDAGVGTHGGSEDHAAMLLGRPGHISAFSFVPLRRLEQVRLPAEWRFIIATSGVRATKTGNARDAYNRLADGVSRLVQLWNDCEGPADSLAGALRGSSSEFIRGASPPGPPDTLPPSPALRRDLAGAGRSRNGPATTEAGARGDPNAPLLSRGALAPIVRTLRPDHTPNQSGPTPGRDSSALGRLRELIRHRAVPGWTIDDLEKRLDHFLLEDARIPQALGAFGNADGTTLGALAEQSQRDAEQRLGNQVAETIALARLAREVGAFAACSFGAGFGGSVWALAPREDAEMCAREWIVRFRREYPTQEHAIAFVAPIAPPMMEIDLSIS
jgi:galactokinase